ncbi:hypothetical protein [Bacillus sp. V2I10]|uniref:hypothetical protein n=1 Tax=Bacillus sp. V2I10 TaxID=3042276 RepID=UPI00278824AE|nr:hypothetical protein [Bacillus sp. V2I10]MDQ0862074.1 alpha-D-ribose 1-methylphosphonate 5-phosphate C-P lyase [Bacillus sp. V2I10]
MKYGLCAVCRQTKDYTELKEVEDQFGNYWVVCQDRKKCLEDLEGKNNQSK